MLPNVMAYPAILHGVLTAGYTVVNVNPLYTPRELVHQLRDAAARILFVLENFGHTVEEALPEVRLDKVVVVTPGDLMGLKGAIVNLVSRHVKKAVKPYKLPASIPFKTVLAEGRKSAPKPVAVGLDDVAFLQYTGGTTGVAKGATLTHRNVAANVAQMELWMKSHLGERPDHVMVTALPLYHIFALTVCAMLMGRLGACQLLIANPRDIPGFVKILKGAKFTLMSGVNTLYNALANNPAIKEVDFSRMRLSVSGGMATQAVVAKKWKELTGSPIVEGYGLSETSPVVCANRLDIAEFTGTIGYPVPSTDVSIRDVDGNVLPAGQPGELCVKGPQVMRGYWEKPDETAKVTTADGYFRTGDVGGAAPRRPGEDRRPDEGHGPGLRLQRLPERGRGGARLAPRRARGGGDRHSGRAFRRGGRGLYRQEGPERHGGRHPGPRPRESHGLQDPADHRVPGEPAQDQCRQGPAARAARRGAGAAQGLRRNETAPPGRAGPFVGPRRRGGRRDLAGAGFARESTKTGAATVGSCRDGVRRAVRRRTSDAERGARQGVTCA